MMGREVVASGLSGGVGCRPANGDSALVFGEYGGRISSLDLVSGVVSVIGEGYSALEDVALSADGGLVYAVERGGDLLVASATAGNRADATVITNGLNSPQQMLLLEDQNAVWVVEYADPARLVEVDLSDGSQRVLSSGLVYAVGLAASADCSRAFVT
jgi:DNA-binding beta-propeller fold protein YncE